MNNIFYILLIILSFGFGFAQTTGTVTDSDGNALPGASVVIKGTTVGTTTNFNGEFNINLSQGDELVVSYVGFGTKEVTYTGGSMSITLDEGEALDEVLVTGNRSKPRTALDSAVPIDNIKTSTVQNTAEASIERALTFSIPSFNSQDQAISDATAGFSPADLRGLGPSRTLVLINGKRVNQQAQAYLNRTPGKGEVGVNLKSIPLAAVERIEVLRDGASSQYGSDAMSGVMNFILKEDSAFSTFNAGTGITSEGDGFQFNVDYNTTLPFGDGGRINLTFAYTDQEKTNRAGSPGLSAFDTTTARQNEIDFATDDPTLGMIVGRPDLKQTTIFANITHPLGENGEFYMTHGYSERWNRSFAYYRFPGWRRDVADANFLTKSPEDFIGYHPTFEGDIKDFFNVVGVDFDLGNDWKLDMSVTHGKNSINYTVNRSVNRDYLADNGWSPRSFKPGGYAFSNIIQNADLTKSFSDQVSFSAGMEYKTEKFEAFSGDPFSRYGGGSDSFAGISKDQEGEWERNNFALYSGLDVDFSEDFLISIAGRYENFSDFGTNFSWKVASRYKLSEKSALRASVSTGFRAPSLHQKYLSNTQYIIVAGSDEPLLQGTLQNGTPAVRALGIKDLFAETSQNFTAGFTFGNNNGFSGSIDFYSIKVNDRILFTSQISDPIPQEEKRPRDFMMSELQTLLDSAGVVSVQAWINAGNTKTTGLDFVLNWKKDALDLGLIGNFNETKIESIDTPTELSSTKIFAREEKGLITNSRPKSKLILTADYDMGRWTAGLYNTRFGEVTVTAPLEYDDIIGTDDLNFDGTPVLDDQGNASTRDIITGREAIVKGIDQVLSAKLITDFRLAYKFTPQLTLTGIMNNMFDIYPDVTLASTRTSQAGSRFLYSSEVQQQGQLGRNYTLALSYKF
jgi:iron complex outermembrane receptor protein